MKYIWEENDIRRGLRVRIFPTLPKITTVCKLAYPSDHERKFAMVTQDEVSVPYSAAELAAYFTTHNVEPITDPWPQ